MTAHRFSHNVKRFILPIALVVAHSAIANAGTISGGTLLSAADADQLETWAGFSDQDFNFIYGGDNGASTAGFHAAADNAGPTFTIAEVTFSGFRYLLGGYTEASWGGGPNYQTDANAFIYNLTSGIKQDVVNSNAAIYRHTSYAPTFGGGHDLRLGASGTIGGATNYVYRSSYNGSQNLLGNSGISTFSVQRVEIFTSADAVPAPAPSALLLSLVAFCGLAARRRVSRPQ